MSKVFKETKSFQMGATINIFRTDYESGDVPPPRFEVLTADNRLLGWVAWDENRSSYVFMHDLNSYSQTIRHPFTTTTLKEISDLITRANAEVRFGLKEAK